MSNNGATLSSGLGALSGDVHHETLIHIGLQVGGLIGINRRFWADDTTSTTDAERTGNAGAKQKAPQSAASKVCSTQVDAKRLQQGAKKFRADCIKNSSGAT
jgi:hypothetical protein